MLGSAFMICWSVLLSIEFVGGDPWRVALAYGILVGFPLLGGILISWCLMPAKWKLGAGAALMLLGFLPHIVHWHPRQAFVARLGFVKRGMTISQVEGLMGTYKKGAGTKWGQSTSAYPPDRARATGSMVYRWSDDGAFDSDFGVGRVRRRQGH